MVLSLRKFTRLGQRNKAFTFALGIAIIAIATPQGRQALRSSGPALQTFGSGFGSSVESIIPLDIFGRELGSFGNGFGQFGTGINTGITQILSPMTTLITSVFGSFAGFRNRFFKEEEQGN